jgi:multidrug efflux system membrane fusion protein
VALLGAAAWVVQRQRGPAEKPGARETGPQARVVPVVAAQVQKRDVPLFLEGLGTAIASKTVTVRPQVDGRLEQVLFREGQEVRKGAQLAQVDPRPFLIQLHQAEGALARDQAQLGAARLDLKRYSDLVAGKLVAQQQVDSQGALVGQLEGTVRIGQAQVEAARLALDYARIAAPIDGVTGIRLVDPGNVVRASDPTGLVVIAQLDPIAVIFTLAQDELASVSGALRGAELPVEAWSRDGAVKLATGKLALIDNQINQASATLRLKALLPNPQRALWPNQFVKARLLVSTRRDALVVPATAVQRGPEGSFAWVIGPDQTVAARPIEVERIQADSAILSRGLEPGETVVIEGQGQLRAGAKVAPRLAGQKQRPPARGQEGRALGSGR